MSRTEKSATRRFMQRVADWDFQFWLRSNGEMGVIEHYAVRKWLAGHAGQDRIPTIVDPVPSRGSRTWISGVAEQRRGKSTLRLDHCGT
jgi:hypothetical protein